MTLNPMAWEGGVNPRVEGNQQAMDCMLPMGEGAAQRDERSRDRSTNRGRRRGRAKGRGHARLWRRRAPAWLAKHAATRPLLAPPPPTHTPTARPPAAPQGSPLRMWPPSLVCPAPPRTHLRPAATRWRPPRAPPGGSVRRSCQCTPSCATPRPVGAGAAPWTTTPTPLRSALSGCLPAGPPVWGAPLARCRFPACVSLPHLSHAAAGD